MLQMHLEKKCKLFNVKFKSFLSWWTSGYYAEQTYYLLMEDDLWNRNEWVCFFAEDIFALDSYSPFDSVELRRKVQEYEFESWYTLWFDVTLNTVHHANYKFGTFHFL